MSQAPSEPTTDLTASTELTESDRYRLLSDDRRRIVLDILADRVTAITLEELAQTVAEREEDTEAPATTTVERITISLHHKHLPKMAAHGVIEYDRDSKRIA